MTTKIDNWYTTLGADPYRAPEMCFTRLGGIVTDHPEIKDGDHVYTAAIDKVDGRKITTVDGVVYHLGKIEPKFRQCIRDEGREYDPHNPIKDMR